VSATVRDWLAHLREPQHPDEHEVKELLASHGIAVPRGARLDREAEIGDLGLPPPFAVKACAPELLHKTEQGGVLLGIDRDDLAAAVADIRARFPGSQVLVEEQVESAPPECILGAISDPDFGPAVMVGAGGILTEVHADACFRLAPCPLAEARHMLSELRIAPLFEGARGLRADADALAEVVARVSALAISLGDRLGQLDINPIVFSQQRWIALDAALLLR